ncbi:MAG: hypothetical protein A2Y38_22330 [Spirochaetes bacterium GWB1_59_5]|nr:MAG: hypothetical protein A2Y38_22330 [Spirochaetes bacterium GWB1_59_5]
MSKRTKDVSYRTGKVEVLLRPTFSEPGVFCVLVRDGYSQIMTFRGDYKGAVDHARILFSIIDTALRAERAKP